MVMAVIVPQYAHPPELTLRIGAGISVAWTIVTPMPASEVGKVPAPANTGCVGGLDTPVVNMVMTWPGAMLIEPGNRYPAPAIAPVEFALWPSAKTPTAATIRMKRVVE